MVAIFIIKKDFLEGSLNEIFDRIIKLGTEGTLRIINKKN